MDESTDFSTLCQQCVRLETQFFRQTTDRRAYYRSPKPFFHHPTYADLVKSAISGCDLCVLLRYGLRDAYIRDQTMENVDANNVDGKLFDEDGANPSPLDNHQSSPKLPTHFGQLRLEILSDGYHTNFTNMVNGETRIGHATMVLTREWGTLAGPGASFILATQPTEDDYFHRSRLEDSADRSQTPPLEDASSPPADAAFRDGHFYGREMQRNPDLGLAARWIAECKRWHKCEEICGTNVIPSRLVEIQVDKIGVSGIRIIETDDKQAYEYVCLSHRWSENMSYKTTKKNYAERLKCLNILALPKTFRDAVTVTSKLGYCFLWIDSLCIVQDDTADWESECTKMAGIYAGAQITLTSPGAKNSDAGLLHPRGPDIAGPVCNLRFRGHSGSVTGAVRISHVTLERGQWSYCFPDRTSYLEDRGWILQERVLSSRVLYFGVCQMYFECNSCRHFEMLQFPVHIPRDEALVKEKLSQSQSKHELFSRWYKILDNYALRKLTVPMDRLPAISGIARVIHNSTSSQYLAGLWRDDLPRGLTWRNHQHSRLRGNNPPHTSLPYRAPSWSWAARSDCTGIEPAYELENEEVKSFLEIVSAETTLAGHDPFGPVKGGVLKVRGKTRLGVVVSLPKSSYMSDLALSDPCSANRHIVAPFIADEADFIKRTDKSSAEYDVDSLKVVVLLVSQLIFNAGGQKPRRKTATIALGLQRRSSDAAYVRIGIIRDDYFREVSQVETWFQNANVTELEIR